VIDLATDANVLVAELLRRVGLNPGYMRRYPHEFSGGQRQRIGVARTLALNPQLIVADEHVSALDVSVQAQVVNLLQDLQQDFGLTYLFISHGLAVGEHISTRVAVMYLGDFVEHGDVDDVFDNPQHPYTQALLSAIPVPDPKIQRGRRLVELSGEIPSPIHPPSGCRFHTRCLYAQPSCKVDEPEFVDIGGGHYVACPIRPFKTQRSKAAVLPQASAAN